MRTRNRESGRDMEALRGIGASINEWKRIDRRRTVLDIESKHQKQVWKRETFTYIVSTGGLIGRRRAILQQIKSLSFGAYATEEKSRTQVESSIYRS